MASFVGKSNIAQATSGTTRTPDISGLSLQAGDVVFCHVYLRFTNANAATITPPSGEGWSLAPNGRQSNGTSASYAVYWKAWGQGSSDDSTPTFTSSSAKWGCILTVWRGLNPTTPFDDKTYTVGSASTTMTAPTANSSGANRLVLRMFASTDNNSHASNSEGSLAFGGSDVNVNTGTGYSGSTSYLDGVGSGSAGTATMSQSANGADAYVAWTYVLLPTGANPPATHTSAVEIGRTAWGSDNLLSGSDETSTGKAPSGGVLFSCWTRTTDPGAAPWGRGNFEVLNLFSPGSWCLRAIVANGSASSEASASYNANVMFAAYNGSWYDWLGDFAYYNESGLTTAQTNGWVWVAWQIVVSSTAVTFRQWLKFGVSDPVRGPDQDVSVSLATLRSLLVSNAGWSTAQANAWAPALNAGNFAIGTMFDVGDTHVTRAHITSLDTEPSSETLEAIATRTAADTTAWGDWELDYDGGPNLADSSGNGNDLAVDSGGTTYAGFETPFYAFEQPPSGITGTATASSAAATASGSGTLASTGTATASSAAATASASGALTVAGTATATSAATEVSGSGTVNGPSITGSASATLAAASANGSGTLGVSGSAAADAEAILASASGVAGVAGEASAFVVTATSAAHGSVTVSGTSTFACGTATCAGEGSVTAAGTSTASSAVATASGSGTVTVVGLASLAVGAGTCSATGAIVVAGAASASLAASEISGSGQVDIEGSSLIDLEPTTASALGTLTVAGTVGASTGLATAYGSGSVGNSGIVGSASASVEAATATAAGSLTSQGAGTAESAASTLTSEGLITSSGTSTSACGFTSTSALGDIAAVGAVNAAASASTATASGALVSIGAVDAASAAPTASASGVLKVTGTADASTSAATVLGSGLTEYAGIVGSASASVEAIGATASGALVSIGAVDAATAAIFMYALAGVATSGTANAVASAAAVTASGHLSWPPTGVGIRSTMATEGNLVGILSSEGDLVATIV